MVFQEPGNVYKILIGRHKGRRPFERSGHSYGIILKWVCFWRWGLVWTG